MIKLEDNSNQAALINWMMKEFFFPNPEIKAKRFQYYNICDIWIFFYFDCFDKKQFSSEGTTTGIDGRS